MKKLKFKEQYYCRHQTDVERIVKIFADRSYEISHSDAVRAWEQFSDSMAAGWMILGDDDEVFHDCFRHFEEI